MAKPATPFFSSHLPRHPTFIRCPGPERRGGAEQLAERSSRSLDASAEFLAVQNFSGSLKVPLDGSAELSTLQQKNGRLKKIFGASEFRATRKSYTGRVRKPLDGSAEDLAVQSFSGRLKKIFDGSTARGTGRKAGTGSVTGH
ncbi:MAG TPA: hypothetical protein VN493_18650 [Thermoanaerobaculia bacterium]|nr:hypothetical protein [Thermoanaerobaculia bacterium]